MIRIITKERSVMHGLRQLYAKFDPGDSREAMFSFSDPFHRGLSFEVSRISPASASSVPYPGSVGCDKTCVALASNGLEVLEQ